jgi:hypothetical protein
MFSLCISALYYNIPKKLIIFIYLLGIDYINYLNFYIIYFVHCIL